GDLCVDLLVPLHLTVAKVEEGLPPDESTWSLGSAAQVDGIGTAFPRRIEDHREEGLAVVAREIRTIRGPNHAVSEAIAHLELDRDERLVVARQIKPPSPGEDVVDHRVSDEEGQELVQDHPVV